MTLTQITTNGIKNGEILNTDINASAAIDGTKVTPAFGSQNLSTTGTAATGNLSVTGTSSFSSLMFINGGSRHSDFQTAYFGSGLDLQISHDSSNSKIKNKTGELQILANDANDVSAKFLSDGAVELYYDNSKKFETRSNGVMIGGSSGDQALNIAVSDNISQSRIIFSDATNTDGVITYDHNARKLHLGAGTTSATDGDLTIDSSGRVGIGTASPDTLVHVKNTSAAPLQRFESSSYSSFIGTAQANDNAGNGSKAGNLVLRGQTGVAIMGNNGTTTQVKIDADGLKFGSDTAAANALDDYEEGTWTPTLLSGTSLTFSSGRYVKIGAMVYAFWEISMPSTSSSSHMIINNTPFTSINHNASCGGTARDYQQYDIQDGPIYHVPKANTQIQFYKNSGQNFVESNGTTKNFRGCSIYQTA